MSKSTHSNRALTQRVLSDCQTESDATPCNGDVDILTFINIPFSIDLLHRLFYFITSTLVVVGVGSSNTST